MIHHIANTFGLIGVFITLIGYFLLQTDKIQSSSKAYALYNLTGTLLILISLCDRFNLPAVIMETAWGIISIYGLLKPRKSS